MEEVQLKKKAVGVSGEESRILIVFLERQSMVITGHWQWGLMSDVIFCSDVMVFPPGFEGTKAIIHPDDLPELHKINSEMQAPFELSFRIITTYGEVKNLQGKNLWLEPLDPQTILPEDSFSKAEAEYKMRLELQRSRVHRTTYEIADRITQSGAWNFNLNTSETWYADGVYRIHGIIPRSLNVHLHTFHSFIHPEDHKAVLEAIDAALTNIAPLNVEYRIITAGDEERMIHQSINWNFNEKGEMVLYGLFRDITEQQQLDAALEQAQTATDLQKQLLHFAETATSIGYWQLNIVTRRLIFSDNYYRIFGLKPQSIPASSGPFLNYIHPDDRDLYEQVLRKIRKEHTVPEIEFRIIRPDGKTRYVRQKGRPGISGKELVMMGTLQDITVQKSLEKKLAGQQESLHVKSFIYQEAEVTAGIGSWLWNIKTGDISWSDNFYDMLGLKVQSVKFTQRMLQQAIHPEDQKKFSYELGLFLREKKEREFVFRLISKGNILHLKTSFKILAYNDNEIFIGTVQDITAQQEIKKTLSDRIRMIEHLGDSIPDIIIVTDTDNNIVLWNHRSEVLFKRKKDKAIGENFFYVLPQLKEQAVIHNLNKAIEGETVHLENYKPVNPLKGFYDISLIPLMDESDKVIGVLHLLHDVTVEYKLHLQLSGRLQLIESLVEASIDRIIAMDKDMNYLYWNKKAEEFYGINKEAVIGKNILEIFPRHQKLPGYGQFREALRGKTVHLSVDSAETEGYEETYLIPVLNEKGEADVVLWITHNLEAEYKLLQQQKEAQERLEKEHQLLKEVQEQVKEQSYYLQRITDTVPDMISVIELETGDTSFLNREVFLANGFDPEKMAARSPREKSEIIHPDDRDVLQNYFASFNAASEEDTITAEYRAKTDSGEWQRFFVRGKVFQRDQVGKPTHVLNVIQNITGRKKTEQEVLELKDALATRATDKYLSLFNSIDEGFCIIEVLFDENGAAYDYRFLEANNAFEKQTGLTNAVGRTMKEMVPEHEQHWFDIYGRIAKTGESERFENEAKAIGRYYEVYAFCIDATTENRVAVLFNDISERKKQQKV